MSDPASRGRGHLVSGQRRCAQARCPGVPRRRSRCVRSRASRALIAPACRTDVFRSGRRLTPTRRRAAATTTWPFSSGHRTSSAFDGVALYPEGAFESPLGPARDRSSGGAGDSGGLAARAIVGVRAPARAFARNAAAVSHTCLARRAHRAVADGISGTRDTIDALAEALASALRGRRALIVGEYRSVALSSTRPPPRRSTRVCSRWSRHSIPTRSSISSSSIPSDERGRYVACGGGPAISVLLAARALGASAARVLQYGHSGEISGDLRRRRRLYGGCRG